jgi:hypothetical protein
LRLSPDGVHSGDDKDFGQRARRRRGGRPAIFQGRCGKARELDRAG